MVNTLQPLLLNILMYTGPDYQLVFLLIFVLTSSFKSRVTQLSGICCTRNVKYVSNNIN